MKTASRSARPSDETIWNVAATDVDAEAPRREDEQLALEMDRPRP